MGGTWKKYLLASVVALVALALGVTSTYLWTQWLDRADSQATVEPSPSPSNTPLSLPIRLDLASVSVPHPAELNECYAPWNDETASDSPISVELTATTSDNTISLDVTYINTTGERLTFLSHPYGVVMVDDAKVVSTLGWEPQPVAPIEVEASSRVTLSNRMVFTQSSLCSHLDAFNELIDNHIDGTLSDAQFNTRLAEFNAMPPDLPSGTYTFYAWAPVVFGAQAAAAQVWMDAGYEDVSRLTVLEPANPLLDDDRLGRYCSMPDTDSPFAEAAFVCATVPDAVWDAVLTKNVATDSIVAIPATIVVSPPLVVVIP